MPLYPLKLKKKTPIVDYYYSISQKKKTDFLALD